MPANFFELQRYAATGLASPDMTAYDKLRARALFPQSYPSTTVTGVPPLSFKSNGQPLSAWSISGNSRQNGTPAPDAPIYPDFVGTLSAGIWTIPITNAGQTTPIYLGQVQTVRRIKKLVLTGNESFNKTTISDSAWRFVYTFPQVEVLLNARASSICSHFTYQPNWAIANGFCWSNVGNTIYFMTDFEDFPTFLQQQYAAGTPVTVWYVLADSETAAVNEPLAKIGNYADTVSSENAGAPSIPTVKGQNTLTVDTTLQPSSVTITT